MGRPPHILRPPRDPKFELLPVVDGIFDVHFVIPEWDLEEEAPKRECPIEVASTR